MGRLDLPDPRRDEDSVDDPTNERSEQGDDRPLTEHFEYGVLFLRTNQVHRSGMTQLEATNWVAEWDDGLGKPGAFLVIRRAVGPWEQA